LSQDEKLVLFLIVAFILLVLVLYSPCPIGFDFGLTDLSVF